jgi:hypothetical protein
MRTAEAQPVACTLDFQAMGPRLAWIRKATEQNLLSHQLDGRTLRLVYRPEAADEVKRIVELERTCCAFLDFSLAADAQGAVLTITAPEGADAEAKWLFAQFLPQGAAEPTKASTCGCAGNRG